EVGRRAREVGSRSERRVRVVLAQTLRGLHVRRGVALSKIQLREPPERGVRPHGAAVLDDHPLQVGGYRARVGRDDPRSEEGTRVEGILRRQPREQAPQDSLYPGDRKSTRLNSSHGSSSYAVFCLK